MSRIAFIAHLSEISGSGVALVDNAAAMQALGHEVFFILPGNGPLSERAARAGLTSHVITAPEVSISEARGLMKGRVLSHRLAYVKQLKRFLKENKIELAYVNSSANIFPGIAARQAGVPIVWHIHENLVLDSWKPRLKKQIISRLADGLIFASNSGLTAFGPPSEIPVIIARNAIRFTTLTGIRDNRHLAPDIAQFTIVANGTIPRKATDVFLKAIALCKSMDAGKSFKVRISGPEPSKDFGMQLDKIITSASLETTVEFVGVIDSLAPELARADLFVSPSRNEALPISIVEAMAAGVPVVATDVGDCGDLLDHGRCGWVVPPEDPEALAAAITEALGNRELAQQIADAAYDKVTGLYGSADFWQPLEKFVSGIIATR